MNPAPHATHEATGEYYALVLLYHPTYSHTIICPDGTEYGHYSNRANGPVSAELDRLNEQDHAARAMTDADRLAAIRAVVDKLDALEDPSAEDADRMSALNGIRDILNNRNLEHYGL